MLAMPVVNECQEGALIPVVIYSIVLATELLLKIHRS
jgi:hypothetical protein